jgi:hypothetical protein
VDSVVAGLLIVGLTVAVDEDRDHAKAVARQFMSTTVARLGSPMPGTSSDTGTPTTNLRRGPTVRSTTSSARATPTQSPPRSSNTLPPAQTMFG